MTTSIKEFYLNGSDIQFLLDQMQFPTILVIGYAPSGQPIYGLSAAGVPTDTVTVKGHNVAVTTSTLTGARVISIQSIYAVSGLSISGALGSFNPLDPLFSSITYHDAATNTDIALPSYTSARDYEGLRNVTGAFNNLIEGQLSWGAANETFLRLVNPDYAHYLQGDVAGNLLTSNTAKNFHTSSTTILNETAPVDEGVTVLGAHFTATSWTDTVTRSEKNITLSSLGHHTAVNQGSSTATTIDATQNWVQIGNTTSYSEQITSQSQVVNTNYISGGELDNTTYVKFDSTVNAWVPATSSEAGAMLAHTFKTANGLDGHPHYSDPLVDVVDYTPRMISQTIASSYNQPDSALERLGIATDTATYDVTNVDGTTSSYTEHFIENTNSYDADPSYSGWFVLFGQFFDHGLDFIQKPGSGPTIQIALAVDDPLYGQMGPDGQPVTSLNISRATPSSGGAGQYQNTDSPYIDQNQTYGATEQITQLLREWVKDPNTGAWVPGAALLDGHTVEQSYLSSVFSDKGAANADGEGLTNRTLPTLNELRAALAATGRDDLSWEDISNYRIRDARGHVVDGDAATTGIQGIGTGQAVILDMLPRFDADHIKAGQITNLHGVQNVSSISIDMVSFSQGDVLFQYTWTDSTGSHTATSDLFSNFDFATNAIRAVDPVLHQVLSEILLQSIGDHYVAGDGRANENFGLTTVHHVFHEDHNVQLVNLESTILAGMYDDNPDKPKGYDWMVKVAAKIGDTVATTGHVEPDATHQNYVGATYDFSNIHADLNGNYVADLTNIRDARGNIITGSDGVTPLTVHGINTDLQGVVSWNQDMLFNASKLIVEMEYQHVAIDQYARFVTPDLPEFVTYDANINADISLEYAQAAFRFGHSQLRETIDAIETQGADHNFDVTGTVVHYALAAGFLNPAEFAEVGPGAIALGMTHQVGNETDEFVTSALQQNLLGQPLDLAAINIARGRDVGIPTLNEVRKQLYDALVAERANTNGPTAQAHANIQLDLLKPYNSWNEFAGSMIHPESLVNFIAAYSFDGDLQKAAAVIGLDAGTMTLAAAQAALGASFTASMAHQFMNGSLNSDGSYAVAGADGFNSVDLWIGGLAESHVLGGILGPTFNAIFEDQMERLMDGDRFYYLYRLFGALPQITNLNTQITNEQFKDIVERTTGVTHLNGDIMLYADSYIELGHHASSPAAAGDEHKYGDQVSSLHMGVYSSGGASTGGNGELITVLNPEYSADPANVHAHSVPQFLTYINDVRPDSPDINSNGNPTYGFNSHEVIAGTDYNDYIDTGDGDDTAYGGKGNDILVGNGGSEHLYGEDGNDILYGAGGTAGADVADFLDGGAGDDYIYGGQNAGATEILIGGKGNDHLYGEAGIDELYGDDGDDYIDAGGDTDLAFGGAGNDEMYGGEGPDELHGGDGSDLISGGSGTDKLEGEQGDDILFGGQGGGVAQGDSDELIGGDAASAFDPGFNLAAYSDSSIQLDVAADLNNQQLQGVIGTNAGNSIPFEPFNHFYMDINGVIGTKYDDQFAAIATDGTNRNNPGGAGLIGDDAENWLIGGSGNDAMEGRGGNDVVVGDSIKLAALDTFLGKVGFEQHFTELLTTRPDFVLGDNGIDPLHQAGASDKVVFTGNLADYKLEALDVNGNVIATAITSGNSNTTITQAPGADLANVYAVRVTDNIVSRTLGDGVTTIPGDGTDILIGVEKAQFANTSIGNLTGFFDIAPTLDLHYVEVTATANAAATFSGNGSSAYGSGSGWTGNWTESGDNSGTAATGGQILASATSLDGGTGSLQIVGGSGNTYNGASISRGVNLDHITSAHVSFQVSASGLGSGESVAVYLTNDGNAPGNGDVLVTTISANTGSVQKDFDVTGNFGVNSRLYFVASSMNSGTSVTIDNVKVTGHGTYDSASGTGYSTDYTERAAGVAIASTPSITDLDGATIASATVHIRETVAGDILTVGNLTGTGITASGSGTGTITLTGVASHAVYQTALAGITFSNPTNHNPTNGANTAARHVDVTVNDGFKDSNLATTTVTVHALNEPTITGADHIVTNATTFVVPDTVLLTNDSDPDSTLAISGTSGANGLSASHSATNQTITVTDSGAAGGSFNYTVNGVNGAVTMNRVTGSTVNGGTGADIVIGGTGNDTLNGAGGNDTIVWNASGTVTRNNNGTFSTNVTTDGHDFVDGGSGADTFVLNSTVTGTGFGNNLNLANARPDVSETFNIYSNTDHWDGNAASVSSAAHAGLTGLNVNTEIVITRNGAVVAELAHIEEIVINTGPGNDIVTPVGNFNGTNLAYSTITINDANGGDKVDITGLTSEHRIVFNTDANGHVVGELRPQDVVNVSGGTSGSGTGGTPGPVHTPGDTFYFNTIREAGNNASRHVISHFDTAQTDPTEYDILNLSGIDANTGKRGDQVFIWDGTEVMNDKHARGHVGYHYVTINGVEHTIISGNTNSNSHGHNFQIDLVGHLTFTTSGHDTDLIL